MLFETTGFSFVVTGHDSCTTGIPWAWMHKCGVSRDSVRDHNVALISLSNHDLLAFSNANANGFEHKQYISARNQQFEGIQG